MQSAPACGLEEIPAKARRRHPKWGNAQILTTYVLDELLKPDRPDDALAYVAFTASDLWPGEDWNFVFGQASLGERTGVWSIYRNGDTTKGQAQFQLCLKRTLGTAAHETGHILSMPHCTTHKCMMNGSNSQRESDGKPLYLCPICLRKLCWNLQVEPATYLERLRGFCIGNGLLEEAEWYRRGVGDSEEVTGRTSFRQCRATIGTPTDNRYAVIPADERLKDLGRDKLSSSGSMGGQVS